MHIPSLRSHGLLTAVPRSRVHQAQERAAVEAPDPRQALGPRGIRPAEAGGRQESVQGTLHGHQHGDGAAELKRERSLFSVVIPRHVRIQVDRLDIPRRGCGALRGHRALALRPSGKAAQPQARRACEHLHRPPGSGAQDQHVAHAISQVIGDLVILRDLGPAPRQALEAPQPLLQLVRLLGNPAQDPLDAEGPTDHFEEAHAEAPDVGREAVVAAGLRRGGDAALDDLGRAERQGAASLLQFLGLAHDLGREAEVGEPQDLVAIAHQPCVGLQVAVANKRAVQVVHSSRLLVDERGHHIPWQHTASVLLKVLLGEGLQMPGAGII
mmetsp:Transcript_113044/g.359166  ORF Transcript_113044/g.359166 Transcript_113044/m.359166 type:complete len:326 (+) Transcript_113044:60-1037(+)